MVNNLNVLSNRSSLLVLILIGVLCLVVVDCSNNKPMEPSEVELDINYNDFAIIEGISLGNRPWYNVSDPVDLEPTYYHDAQGVIVSQVDGQWYYHPWQVLSWGLMYLSSFELTRDSRYLEIAQRYSDRLILMGNRVNNSIYFPYEFNHILHGGSSHDAMMAPWYSGLAQGMALCFYSRFYEITNDPYYKDIADSIFQCYLYTDSSNSVWTSMIDSAKYYWVEEYPFHPLDHVFNGFQTAVICLYDYYQISHNSLCKTIFDAGCTTLERNFDSYRVPGGISYYCLRHKVQLDDYHRLHITQLEWLFMITGDSSFISMADTLRSDFY
jgi:hypothetical protein